MGKVDTHTHKHGVGVASTARHSKTGGGSMWKRARYGGLAVGLSMSVSICLLLVTLRGFTMVEASSRSFSSSGSAAGYTKDRLHELREEVRSMFHHGWDNYMLHAFPADEIKPITCTQSRRTRPPEPLNLGLNDVLGNYSLTAIDTLSTLAILAESSPADKMRFWRAAEELRVRFYPEEEYPDGSTKEMEQRRRYIRQWKKSGIGFDIDSRVQVFEATIRVLGGLLSAHLYATGEFGGVVLPVPKTLELTAEERKSGIWKWFGKSGSFVRTNGEFSYDGWLLDLAYDLGERLLPALEVSKSGLPYPRVNLRWGLQHGTKPNVKGYKYSYVREGKSHHADYSRGRRDFDKGPEVPPTEELPDTITITCPAGAGSLVLEFTTLSRLTGDGRFEEVAKRAFESVWKMRSGIGLIGAELDAEKGEWMQYFSGIGAGIDSFFEYALKAYILLSPAPSFSPTSDAALSDSAKESTENQGLFSPEWFLDVWTQSNNAISRHSLRDHPSPHYLNVHMTTGAAVLSWIDSVSAFFPGLLTLSGHVNLAKHTHLVPTALWSRYHSLPERWNVRTGHVESGLKWWPGRPEFIESNYFLYTATGDQWYLKVGEIVLEDIRKRCKSVCGWAGLEDVEGAGGEGEMADRMESFFLGETFQYLYMLFDREGKLERNESAWVYSTEGHPLIIPKWTYDQNPRHRTLSKSDPSLPPSPLSPYKPKFCENPRFRPDTTESISTHPNFFHAFHFTHAYPPPPSLYPSPSLTVNPHLPPTISTLSLSEPTCAPIPDPHKYAFDLLFPSPDDSLSSSSGNKFQSPQRNYQRIPDGNGLFIHDMANLRLSFVAEGAGEGISELRISKVNNIGLGRDEKVFFPESLLAGFGRDDNFGVREAGGGKVDIAIEWQEENEGAAGDVIVDEVASDIGEDENDYEEEERELVKIYKKLEEEVEQLMGGLEGDKKLLDQLVAGKEEGGFWAKSANGLVEQVKGLQREIAQFFDSSALVPGAPSRLQQKNKRQHQHILTTGTKKDHAPTQRRITIYPALLATGPGAEPLPPPPISSSRQASKPTWPPPAPPIHYARIYIPPHHSESKSSPSYACPNLDTPSTDKTLHSLIPADTQVLMLHRGWCKFADKIKSLPVDDSLPSLKLVILVDFDSTSPKELVASASGTNTGLTRPYIDEPQGWEISPDGQSWEGMKRKRKVGVLMVRGEGLWEGLLKRGAKGVSVLRKWEVVVGPGNPKIAGGVGAPGGTRVGNAKVVRG